ncbi:MAG: hypothetical protein EAZ64_09625 [Sphingobacteriales bacterium]|nr:MAG: hypothetical protein EAZ64_09625 [Sphingobacteriales bacterium]
MNKLFYFLILYFFFFLIESIVGCLILWFYLSDSDFRGCFRAIAMWDLWRLMFYGLPFIILYFLLFKYVGNIKLFKPLLFSLFNLIVYVGLSVLSKNIWGNVPLPPEGVMFWIACVVITLSPLILGQIPYFKELMESL